MGTKPSASHSSRGCGDSITLRAFPSVERCVAVAACTHISTVVLVLLQQWRGSGTRTEHNKYFSLVSRGCGLFYKSWVVGCAFLLLLMLSTTLISCVADADMVLWAQRGLERWVKSNTTLHSKSPPGCTAPTASGADDGHDCALSGRATILPGLCTARFQVDCRLQ